MQIKGVIATLYILVAGLVLIAIDVMANRGIGPPTRRVWNGVVYEETYDAEGRIHGVQRIYSGDFLCTIRKFDHGYIIESIEYNPDGTIKSRSTENNDYQLNHE